MSNRYTFHSGDRMSYSRRDCMKIALVMWEKRINIEKYYR